MVKVFIGGLRQEVQEIDIAKLVSLYGDLKAIKVVRDRKTGKCKGYAFLEVTAPNDAKGMINALDDTKFQGQTLTLKEMKE